MSISVLGKARLFLSVMAVVAFSALVLIGCGKDDDDGMNDEPPKVRQFTVAFNTDGGTPATIASVTVDSGAAIGAAKLPPDPAKTGYIFEGWFSGNTQYTAATVINATVTLTAKWTEVPVEPPAPLTCAEGEAWVMTITYQGQEVSRVAVILKDDGSFEQAIGYIGDNGELSVPYHAIKTGTWSASGSNITMTTTWISPSWGEEPGPPTESGTYTISGKTATFNIGGNKSTSTKTSGITVQRGDDWDHDWDCTDEEGNMVDCPDDM